MAIANTRPILELLWTDRLYVFEHTPVGLGADGSTRSEWMPSLQDVPCKLDYSQGAPPASAAEMVTVVEQTAKIFCGLEVVLRPGSKLLVRRPRRGLPTLELCFQQSGEPKTFGSHQEVEVKNFEQMA